MPRGKQIVYNAPLIKIASAAAAKTRPADTTAYAAGDVINESTSAGTGWVFADSVTTPGGTGVIKRVYINDSAYVATNLSAELFLFDTVVGVDNDNAAFTPTDAEMLTCVAVVPVSTGRPGDITAGAGGNSLLESADVNIPFKCASGSTTLYGVLVARNAYVPVSGEIFTIRVIIQQD
jgi:hypothetical protein